MTDRLTELLTDEPVPTQLESHDDRRPAVAHWRNELRREVRPEVEALRDRVRELEALLNSLMAPTKTTFGATLEGRTE